jgi:hypothetical protein
VKIRDFAFPPSDDRYLGNGPDVPRPNKYPRIGDYDYEVEDLAFESDQRGRSGWGVVWGGLTKRLSWTFGKSGKSSPASSVIDGPSKTDFERNFDMNTPVDEKADPQDTEEYGDQQAEDEEPGELVPGTYRAMFAFEPEGTAEMALVEDQIVYIIGRGGGVGWAIVQNEDKSRALVPESYLEFVES